MAKRKYKRKQKDDCDNSVYVFHNQLFNFDMFINATMLMKLWKSLTNVAWVIETNGKS